MVYRHFALRTSWTTLCLLALAPFPTIAAGSPLDAPIVRQPPTVRSELQRGQDAAERCRSDHTFEVDLFEKCIEAAQADNRQKMGQGFEAFDAGCYFTAWIQANLLVSSKAATAHIQEKFFWREYVESRKKIGVTDDDVIESLKISGPIKDMVTDAGKRYGG